MKKTIATISLVTILVPSIAFAQLSVPQGGTGKTSFPQNSLIYADNGGLQRLQATSSPTVGYIQATSSNATSTLPNLAVTAISIAGEYISNFTSYVRSLFSGTSPINYNNSTGVISCPTCVTNVTGSGNIASSGGTTPNITFTGVLPIASGGTNASSFPISNTLAYYNGTSITSTSTNPLYVDKLAATSTASSTFAGGIDAARVCLTGTTTCLGTSGGGSSGKTIDGYFATSSVPNASYPFATTTSVTNGGALFITATCVKPNAAGNTIYHLDVWNSTTNSTTTVGAAMTQSAGGSNSNMSVTMNGLYSATASGLVRISWADSTDTISDASNCNTNGVGNAVFINMQWIRFSN